MPPRTTIAEILWRYKQQEQLTAEELNQLQLWLRASTDNEKLFDDLSNEKKWDASVGKWQSGDLDASRNKLMARIAALSPARAVKKPALNRLVLAAAILIAVLSAGIYIWTGKRALPKGLDGLPDVSIGQSEKIPASGVTITLANGEKVSVDTIGTGSSVAQSNARMIKTDSGAIAYTTASANTAVEIFNVLQTPRGFQYQVLLSDGSRVWLNALSSLRYPVSFNGPVRAVELTGEAYFEVAKNKAKPFIVRTENSASVKVIGTHFNIKAYPEEPVLTVTLLEGSVAVSNKHDSAMIRPGETANLAQGKWIVTLTDPEQVMAWRNKLFWYRKASFQTIMRDLARWYDIEVEYQGDIKQTYSGILPSTLSLPAVLQMLERSGNVHFTMADGNKVIVRP